MGKHIYHIILQYEAYPYEECEDVGISSRNGKNFLWE